MAAEAGRNLLILLDTGDTGSPVEIAGQNNGSMTFNRESIDVTTKSDNGIRTLLDEMGTFSVDISVEGILKDATLITEAAKSGASNIYPGEVTIGSIGTLEGDFFLANVEITGQDGANAIGFTASLQSSGAVTFT